MTQRVRRTDIRLLVVHWHPVVLRGLVAYLGHAPGFALVGKAATCEEALGIMAELHPDIVVMGYSTPLMRGMEATRRLAESHPGVRVVLVGASGGAERMVGTLQCGGAGYMLLDTPPSEMLETLRGLSRGARGTVA
ncbi:MAG TPA: response regulator transcription factor [Candidatus Dormibacteraeota bacterium]